MTLKKLLLIVLCSQLLGSAVSETNITEDALVAIQDFKDEIRSSVNKITVTIPILWATSLNETKERILQQLTYDIGNFSVVLKNLTESANNVTYGKNCVSDLEKFLDIENYHVDVWSSEQEIFFNVHLLATAEIDNILTELDSLEREFLENCVENKTKCESSSRFVIAELKRLTPTVKRIPFEQLAEVHLLEYGLRSNWEVVHMTIVKNYNKVVQNATTCLANTYLSADDKLQPNLELDVEESVFETYAKLVVIADNAFSSTLNYLVSSFTEILIQSGNENDITMNKTRNAIFIANQTVNALFKIAADFNITTNCTSPNLLTVLNSSILRGLMEYTSYVNVVDNIFVEGVYSLNNTMTQITALGLQVEECYDDTCEFLSKKLTKKMTSLPLEIYSKGNATAVLLFQPLVRLQESGSKIVLDVLEMLEADIVALKSYIRVSLY